MTLHEFLKVCSWEEYVGIYNMDTSFNQSRKSSKRYEVQPTLQHYSKIKNIQYGQIRHFLDFEVIGARHNEKGIYIQISRKYGENARDNRELARNIAKAIKGEL